MIDRAAQLIRALAGAPLDAEADRIASALVGSGLDARDAAGALVAGVEAARDADRSPLLGWATWIAIAAIAGGIFGALGIYRLYVWVAAGAAPWTALLVSAGVIPAALHLSRTVRAARTARASEAISASFDLLRAGASVSSMIDVAAYLAGTARSAVEEALEKPLLPAGLEAGDASRAAAIGLVASERRVRHLRLRSGSAHAFALEWLPALAAVWVAFWFWVLYAFAIAHGVEVET